MRRESHGNFITLAIPAGREPSYSLRIVRELEKPEKPVEVLLARTNTAPLSKEDLSVFNTYFPTRQVLSPIRFAPAMRNALVSESKTSHILFLDDDMMPGKDLLSNAYEVIARDPHSVYQGPPYHVANEENWLARMEGRLYKRIFDNSLAENGKLTFLDARLMLAPTGVLEETPFDEHLVEGGGEGKELAYNLSQKCVPLKVAEELFGKHFNRDTLLALLSQKRTHGRGRGRRLLRYESTDRIHAYLKDRALRYFRNPIKEWADGDLEMEEMAYGIGTNAAFMLGIIEQLFRGYLEHKKK